MAGSPLVFLGIDEEINAGLSTYYIKEHDLPVVVTGVGINDTREQEGGGNFLPVAHHPHHVEGDEAVE